MRRRPPDLAFALVVVLAATGARADVASVPDTLRLAPLQRAAVDADPRQDRRQLDERAADLRIARLSRERLPQFTVLGEVTDQSDVIEIPLDVPGVSVPTPPTDRYAATLRADLLLWDGGRNGAARDVERAGLGVDHAALDADLLDVRREVDTVFFRALVLQERVRETERAVEDLQAQLDETNARVDAGTALAGDAALLEAELLGVRQRGCDLRADRRAALDVLERLTRRTLADDVVLVEPHFGARVESLTAELAATGLTLPASLRVHPRFALIARQRAELERRIDQVRTGALPTVTAFGDVSMASPGQRQFDDTLHDEWRVGVQLRWRPWDWNDRGRRVDELRVHLRELDVRQRTFEEALVRSLREPLRALERLEDALASDDRIIALRQAVVDQATAQLRERAIPASRYVDARTELTRARVDKAIHLAERARTRTAILTTLGLEIDDDA